MDAHQDLLLQLLRTHDLPTRSRLMTEAIVGLDSSEVANLLGRALSLSVDASQAFVELLQSRCPELSEAELEDIVSEAITRVLESHLDDAFWDIVGPLDE